VLARNARPPPAGALSGNNHGVLTLYDADRCPYCARARIVLAEKGVEYETVVVDLDERQAWIYDKNPLGRVPVLEEDTFVLPESAVIMEYLDERYPEPPLLPDDPGERALARLWIGRFDDLLGDAYYAVRKGDESARSWLEARLAALDGALEAQPYLTGRVYGLADVAYLPWVLRLSTDSFTALSTWVERLAQRPAVAREVELVAAR
jgi:glutathione S-transferase